MVIEVFLRFLKKCIEVKMETKAAVIFRSKIISDYGLWKKKFLVYLHPTFSIGQYRYKFRKV